MRIDEFKLWGWDKKPRTMLRFIKPGDIFCFQLAEDKYAFGRIISKITFGHSAEIFNYFSDKSIITPEQINTAKSAIRPVVLDSYSLFDRKYPPEGDWRIIGHQANYQPTDVEGVYFSEGLEDDCWKVDVFGNNKQPISEKEAWKLPRLSPYGIYHIKELLKEAGYL